VLAAALSCAPAQDARNDGKSRGVMVPDTVGALRDWLEERGGPDRAVRMSEFGTGNTALHVAALFGNVDVAEALLAHGARIWVRNDQGRTALHLASDAEGARTTQLLLEAGANPDARDDQDRTALHAQAREGRWDAVEALLDAGANPTLGDIDGCTPANLVPHAWRALPGYARLREAEERWRVGGSGERRTWGCEWRR